jgi:3-oxoacyl-[acyl-carrier protein] reductase
MGGIGELLTGRVAVVTGAGSGIGRALSIGFSTDGATVVGVGHRDSTLAETVELCPGPMTTVRADLSQTDECLRAMEHVIRAQGRVDVLVNNAAASEPGAFLDTPFERWVHMMALNVLGVAACSRAVLPQMMQQGYGRIITLSSRMAGVPMARMSAYSASKAAVSALTGCLAGEISSDHPNVLINDLIPGPTKTAMTSAGQEPEAVYPMVRDLVLLPEGGPSGHAFFRGEPYELFRPR